MMFAGFDFGTSNCAIGIVEQKNNHSDVQLLPINQGKAFMPSMLYAIRRELICESVALNISNEEYTTLRKNQLAQAQRVRREEDIRTGEKTVFIGQEAFDQYLSLPGEGYFVKSVKSFLGANGLQPQTVQFFEDIVTAMMLKIKQEAEQHLQKSIQHTVIGRPVNFQGLNVEQSNRLALGILTAAAKRAGFKSIEFLFEPLAAGLDFETKLDEDKTVLVVDVGGGTTDCSMVRMGPSYRNNYNRDRDFLGHSGQRIGGNDFDIALASKQLMPLFGMNSLFKNGLPIPRQIFLEAVSTNNVGAQTLFNSRETAYNLQQYLLDTKEPALLERFIQLYHKRHNHQLVSSAEQAKIALSSQQDYQVNLDYIENCLQHMMTREQFSMAIKQPLFEMMRLINEVIKQAACQPDFVYITGGAAKSQIIRQTIEEHLGHVNVVDGDHFGSVAKGLTVWAQRLFTEN